jgi:hypothetical protein
LCSDAGNWQSVNFRAHSIVEMGRKALTTDGHPASPSFAEASGWTRIKNLTLILRISLNSIVWRFDDGSRGSQAMVNRSD